MSFPLLDPTIPYCEGGGGTCNDCVGSCGIEEYDIAREVTMRDLTDTHERITFEKLASDSGVLLDARFECGCWVSEVGCQRHPAIVGTMCCPIHLKPYGDNPERRPWK